MSNKKKFLIAAVFVLMVAVAFLVVYINKPCSESKQTMAVDQPTFLYVQTAHSGSLSREGADGQRTLTLSQVSPVTTYFSERPARETGHQSTQEFTAEWSMGEDSFATNPPNAALDILGEDSQSLVIVELINVKYDAATQTLEYQVIILDDESNGNIPEKFDEVALFIDSTHKDLHCECRSKNVGESCFCEFDYSLGKFATKEFRGFCSQDKVEPKRISVSNISKHTTCTVGAPWSDYYSMSCTNWSTTRKDKVTVTVICKWLEPL